MKELKMFPQITEETEENLLNLEEDPFKRPLCSTPPKGCSSPAPESPTEAPSSPNYENQVPCQLPTITTEDVDPTPVSSTSTPDQEEFATPPPRVRMRSLSGGAYRLAPAPQTRTRRQSGDDVLSPSRRAALFEHFRPRSKSDSKGKRPTFLASLKNSFFSGTPRKSSLEEPLEPLEGGRQRSRSGSETRGGTMSKMIDLFRSRSNSVSIEFIGRSRKQSPNSLLPSNARRHSVDPDKRRRPPSNFRSLDFTHPSDAFTCHVVDDEPSDTRIDYGTIDEDKLIPTFLSSHSCYNAMPKSGKVILLSTDLLVKNAFSSLVVNDVRSAPLWDTASQSFVGILTITDFINILRHYHYSTQEDIHAIESQQIQTWRRITSVDRPFVKIDPCDNLSNAVRLMVQEGVHRLPVFDETRNSVLFIITHKRLLQYLHQNFLGKFEKMDIKTPDFMKKTIQELRIGTHEDIVTITPDTTIIEALDLFMQHGVSSLPIVDGFRLIDIFAKFDVFALAKEQSYHDLNMTISEALDKTSVHEEYCTCLMEDTLESVIGIFVFFKVHRVVVIDKDDSVIGIISLSDVLKFLVVRPLALLDGCVTSVNDTIEEEVASASGENDSAIASGSETESADELQKSTDCDLSLDLIKLQVGSETLLDPPVSEPIEVRETS